MKIHKLVVSFFGLIYSNDEIEVPNSYQRIWKLGQAYNADKDRLIFDKAFEYAPGVDEYSVVISKRIEKLDYKMLSTQSMKDVSSVLDVTAEGQMTAMKGYLQGSITGSYSKTAKSFSDESLILIKLRYISKVEGLNLDGIIRTNKAVELAGLANGSKTRATHFVKELVWGGELLVSVRFKKNETMAETLMDASLIGSFDMSDGTRNTFEGSLAANVDMTDRLTEGAEDLDIKVYGVPAPLGTPQNIGEINDYLQKYVSYIKEKFYGEGVPILIKLSPINHVFPIASDRLSNLRVAVDEDAASALVENANSLQSMASKFKNKHDIIDQYTLFTKMSDASFFCDKVVSKGLAVLNNIFDSILNLNPSTVTAEGEIDDSVDPNLPLKMSVDFYNQVGPGYPCYTGNGRFERQILATLELIAECDIDPVSKSSGYCNGNGVCRVYGDPDARSYKPNFETGNLMAVPCLRAKKECVCEPGYFGDNCEYHICETNNGKGPCLNEPFKCERIGKDEPGYRCDCKKPFHGPTCELGLCEMFSDSLETNALPLCRNGGTCNNVAAAPYFHCTCPPGFYGQKCEESVCNANSCSGKGLCSVTGTTENPLAYECSCILGYSGQDCEIPACSVDNGGCTNGGECHMDTRDIDKGYRCDCKHPYKGKYCGFHAGCSRNNVKCQNHGVCLETMNEPYFECKCFAGYSGRFCQTHHCKKNDVTYPDLENCGAAGLCTEVANITDETIEAYFEEKYEMQVNFVQGKHCDFNADLAWAHATGLPLPEEDAHDCSTSNRVSSNIDPVDLSEDSAVENSFLDNLSQNSYSEYYNDYSEYEGYSLENYVDYRRKKRNTDQIGLEERWGPQLEDRVPATNNFQQPETLFSVNKIDPDNVSDLQGQDSNTGGADTHEAVLGFDYDCSCKPGWLKDSFDRCTISICDTEQNPCGYGIAARGECSPSISNIRGYVCTGCFS